MYATHLTSTQKKPILAVPSSLYVNPDVSKSGMIDLKLMHHWTTNASLKTPVSSIAHQIYFQDDLPRMAPRFPCLLHQILALSALHFAYLHPGVSSEYSVRAFQHQNMAIGSMRDALSSGVTRANSTAIYMTSALLVASQFTSRLNNDMRSSCPLAALLEIISLVRGMSAVKKLATQHLSSHPLQHLFLSSPLPSGATAFARLMEDKILALREKLAASTEIGEGDKTIAAAGIQSLLGSLKAANGPSIALTMELRVVFGWLLGMTSEFVGMLQDHQPATLVVLSYYCVCLQAAQSSCWFLGGWATELVKFISVSLANTPWTELISWPLEEIRKYDHECVV
jgi:hypothetical protein